MTECLLYKEYPGLAEAIPRAELGNWPTPLQPLKNLSAFLGGSSIYIKRDDLSHSLYGGNKIRKLELILADAEKRGCHDIITAGGLGSHHVLATAALGKAYGFKVIGLFFCQPVTERVRENLLLEHSFGTEMHFVKDYPGLVFGYIRFYISSNMAGRKPLLLMPGGSSDLSTIGYINCVLEIQEQLKPSGKPEPAAIFTAAGTGGTAAGLLAGLALCGTGTKLHAVRVVRPEILSASRITGLASGALNRLAKQNIKAADIDQASLDGKLKLETGYLGQGYGFSTDKALEATNLFRELEGIELEECYTAKAAAALIDYCRATRQIDGRPVIFIHTASSTHHRAGKKLPEPEALPVAFQWCFKDEARRCRCSLQKQNKSFCAAVSQPGWRWPV
jgi:1-aminocyclopropane-1-carboxylate deaminase/D-cysteine desulfhydrase-like pyridoxal-dependent ACC family enzyme